MFRLPELYLARSQDRLTTVDKKYRIALRQKQFYYTFIFPCEYIGNISLKAIVEKNTDFLFLNSLLGHKHQDEHYETKVPDFPHIIKIRLARSKCFLLRPATLQSLCPMYFQLERLVKQHRIKSLFQSFFPSRSRYQKQDY